MGEGVKVGNSKNIELDEQTILEHYICMFSTQSSFILLFSDLSFIVSRCYQHRSRQPHQLVKAEQTARIWRNLPPE